MSRGFMNNNVLPNENLFRYVLKKFPDFWKTKDNRPTSASLKCAKGISVDRDGGRTTDQIVNTFKSRLNNEPIRAVFFFSAGRCSEIPTYIQPDPIEDNENPEKNNPFHANILDSETTIELDSKKAKQLANMAVVVYLDNQQA